jgi:hypothetical protein
MQVPDVAGEQGRISRRTLLKGFAGAAAVVAAGAGAGIAEAVTSSDGDRAPSVSAGRRVYPYKSEPALRPPPVDVQLSGPTEAGLVFLTPLVRSGGSDSGTLVVDDAGEPAWFAPLASGTDATNLQVQSYRGQPVLTWWEGQIVPPGYGKGAYVLADSSYRQLARVQAGNGLQGDLHEFVLTPAGSALLTAYREEPFDLSAVGGPADGTLLESYLQEVDVASGRVLFQWRASDHVALSESYAPPPSPRTSPYDFFHINSIDVDDDGDLIVSARHTWAIYKVDRSTGAVIWRLNGKRSDFRMAPGAAFSWQHHARHHAGGLLTLFDDGDGLYPSEQQSRGLELALDMTAKRATLTAEYLPRTPILANSQGSVQVLPGGDVFVGWGSEPYYSEYAAGGALRFAAEMSGAQSYRAFRFPWVGEPRVAPAMVAERSGDAVTVYASWNGATEVDRWDVLAGPSAAELTRLETFTRAGFETAMTVRTPHAYVAARALDRDGSELGRSAAVPV